MTTQLAWLKRKTGLDGGPRCLELPFVLRAARRALEQATPAIWNSDQGSHFTSPRYLTLLQQAHVQISMDGKGRALDNIFTERLWRTVKYEEVYLHNYDAPREARTGLSRYLEFYNQGRLHQALAYHTPAEVYFGTSTPQRTHDQRDHAQEEERFNSTIIQKGAASTLELPTFLS